MPGWQDWIGRHEACQGHIEVGMVARWLALLDRGPTVDASVPQGFHWCLFGPEVSTQQLGEDGHPALVDDENSLVPPLGLPRRMWAASRIEFHQPLNPGERLDRRTRLVSISEKQGGTGRLAFVELAHEIACANRLAISETQTLVYRPATCASTAALPPSPSLFDRNDWDAHREIVPNEALLFRYSAVTFNSHRIHYDQPYATREEGYAGLVVHGPLIATLLLDLARRQFGENALGSFAFRAVSPAIAGNGLRLALRSACDAIELGAYTIDGRQVMKAEAALTK